MKIEVNWILYLFISCLWHKERNLSSLYIAIIYLSLLSVVYFMYCSLWYREAYFYPYVRRSFLIPIVSSICHHSLAPKLLTLYSWFLHQLSIIAIQSGWWYYFTETFLKVFSVLVRTSTKKSCIYLSRLVSDEC